MAIIRGGLSGADLDTVSGVNAAKVVAYKTDGTPALPVNVGEYATRVEVIPSTMPVGTTYFAMRNIGSLRAHISKIELKLGFAGTIAASRSIFEIARFTSATPTGGTALPAIKRNTAMPGSTCDIRFGPSGLTIAGITFEAPFHLFGVTSQLNTDHSQDLQWDEGFILQPGEGLAIRASTAIIGGAYLIGSIRWHERA